MYMYAPVRKSSSRTLLSCVSLCLRLYNSGERVLNMSWFEESIKTYGYCERHIVSIDEWVCSVEGR